MFWVLISALKLTAASLTMSKSRTTDPNTLQMLGKSGSKSETSFIAWAPTSKFNLSTCNREVLFTLKPGEKIFYDTEVSLACACIFISLADGCVDT